ncbi:unnamed protein product [Camellia sinensis]
MQSQIVCSGCRSILLYPRGASNVCCALCNAITSVPPPENGDVSAYMWRLPYMAYVYTWGYKCEMLLLSNSEPCTSMGNVRVPIPMHRPNGATTPASMPSTSAAMPHSQTQTVVVENPMSVDESGKLVSNVVVGVTTDKK